MLIAVEIDGDGDHYVPGAIDSGGWDGDPSVLGGGDLNDSDNTVYPGATERIDGQDNDCDGELSPNEVDNDGDGYVEGWMDAGGWDVPPVPGFGDFDDTDPTRYPGAPELFDGKDNDGDGLIDEDFHPPAAEAGGPYVATEGVPIQLDGAGSSDPDEPADSITKYEWDLDGDLDFGDASGVTPWVWFDDDGIIEIRLRVTDEVGLTGEDTATVTVLNNAPVLGDIPDITANEGEIVTITVEFSDLGLEDTHTVTIDWGDGSEPEHVSPVRPAGEASGTAEAAHEYGDDGERDVTVTVKDDESAEDTATSKSYTDNLAPVLGFMIDITGDGKTEDSAWWSISGGDNVLEVVTFSDEGNDTHHGFVDWGDGNAKEPVTVTSQPGGSVVGTVTAGHTYSDTATYTVTVELYDDDGGYDSGTFDVRCDNVAPSITHFDPGSDPFEGQVASVHAEFTDVGLLDTHDATIDWGDGDAPEPGSVARPAGEATGTITGEHTYGDDGGYTVTVTVADDDGGTGSDTVQVAVENVAPTVTRVEPAEEGYMVGDGVVSTAEFEDPGVYDTHEAVWDWGDGTSSAGSVSESGGDGSATGTHVYATAGTYTATVTVTDKDGDSGTGSVPITVEEDSAPARGLIEVAGVDRYATAVEASKEAYPNGASAVVIATGANWPDALGGSALAGIVEGPLLLTRPAALPAEVLGEIGRLGATDAYILGGTGAVSEAVESALGSALSGDVKRLAGANRYGTANEVADEVIRLAGGAYAGTAFVATGANFPDALGASPLAASSGTPILLAPLDGVPYLPEQVSSAVILGGTGAVTGPTEVAVRRELGDAAVERVGGVDRYDTAARIADHGVANGMHWDGVGIATGMAFPDALSGGAMLGTHDSVLLLTRVGSLAMPAEQRLTDHRPEIGTACFIGGVGAVSQEVRDRVAQLLE